MDLEAALAERAVEIFEVGEFRVAPAVVKEG
jgi:hypothetical protein